MAKNTRPPKSPLNRNDLPEGFCAVPFASLLFQPGGNVGSCREHGDQHSVGDVRNETWQEIWNGERIREWRREFLTGEIKTCAEHIRHRGCHKAPMNQALIPLIELNEVQSTPPKRISPNFNGRCNLECPMCKIWQDPNGLYDELGFWENAEKTLFPHVRQLDPLAGEPFVQKDNYRLIDIISRVNPSCEWRFTTNAHWKFSPFVREKLDKINILEMNISLDSLNPETYAQVRKKGNLETVLKTIDDLIEYAEERRKAGRAFTITINTTIQIANWSEVSEIVRFAREKNSFCCIQLVYDPFELSLLSLGDEERARILDYYIATFNQDTFLEAGRVLQPLVDSLPEEKRSGYSTLLALWKRTGSLSETK